MIRSLLGILAIIILSFFAIQPFFTPGFFPMHDDTQVVRVSQMTQALSDRHFPVRWVKDLGYGYGYPLFNFYAPLAYYVGGIFALLGLNALESTKVMMVIGIVLSGAFMYVLAREFWGKIGGIASALFYMYAPYHALDIYVRGAVGEFWAYTFVPLTFYGLWKVIKEPRIKWVVVGAIGLTGVILSHNLTAMMIMPFLLVTILVAYFMTRKKSIIYHLSSIILLGLSLSAFYWLPALLELEYTNVTSQIGGGANFRDHFVCIAQLWDSPWGFGGSTTGCVDGLSFKIGKLHVVTLAVSFFFALLMWKRDKLRSRVVLLVTCCLLLVTYLMLEPSKPIWEVIYPMAFLQYPWRFLLFATFFSSFVAGSLIWFLKQITYGYSRAFAYGTGVLLIGVLIYTNIRLFQPQTIQAKTADDYVNEHHVKWVTSKISDEYMPQGFAKPHYQSDIVRGRTSSGNIVEDKVQRLTFSVDSENDQQVTVNIAPFPAWRITIDDHVAEYEETDKGLRLSVLQGKHMVRAAYVSTMIERLGNIISIVSIIMLLFGILGWHKRVTHLVSRQERLAFFKRKHG